MRRILGQTFLLLLVFFPRVVSAQTTGTSFPPFASVQGGGFDSVNLQNLNVGFGIPVMLHPGRGLDFRYTFFYNSLVWAPTSGSSPQWALPAGFPAGWQKEGPGGALQYSEGLVGFCPGEQVQEWTNFVYTDPSGTAHKFGVIHWGLNGCNIQQENTGYAEDASGYYIDISSPASPVVRSPDGTKFQFSGGAINGAYTLIKPNVTDANGNQITNTTSTQTGETDWTDTLGQTVLKITNQFNNANGLISESDYNRLAVDGTYQVVALKYQLYSVKTNFGCSGIAEYTSSANAVLLVSEVDFPNGQNYVFTYEPTPGSSGFVTARIQQVKLPTGGTITYQYTGPNGGINCADGSVMGLTRTINDGTTPPVMWSYSRVLNGSSGTTTITAPQLPYDAAPNQTVISFNSNGQETSRKLYQGAATGNPVRTINSSWTSGNFNITPVSRVLILEDGITQSQVESTYDSNGNLQVLKEHDWGQGAPGPVLRTTNLSYLPATGSYTGLNLINKVTTQTIADAGGTIRSRTDIAYDGAGFVNVNCITGAAQHDDAGYGCSYTTRGLPTGVTTYTVAATQGGGVTRNFSYDSVGNLITAQLSCCQQKQWSFSSATQYAFPDSVTSGSSGGSQLTTSATYYLTTGQIKTFIDENLQTTTYSYTDPGHLDRLTDVLRPDGAHVKTSYNDSLLTIGEITPVQGASVVQKVVAFDGLGRPIHNTIEDAGNTVYSIVDTQYDPMGRPYKASNPYTVSAQYWTTTQFDALGRTTIVSLPDGAQTSSSYVTNTATANDPAGKQKRSIADGLGRVIEVDEPGDSSAGAQAQGSITISGFLGSKQAIPAASGSGNFTIKGVELFQVVCRPTCHTIYDTGSVSVTVNIPGNTITKSANYTQGSTAQGLANSLANQFTMDGNFQNINVVNTTGPDGIPAYTVYLTAKATGSATNYPYSATQSGVHNDFTATAGGANFTGGVDGQNAATDFGTITLTVGSFTTAPICYGQSCNSTAAQVAAALAEALGASGSPVHNVLVSGSTISMTANQLSSAWNVAVTATPSSGDPADFPQGSFASQGSLSGGVDVYSSGLAHPYVTTYAYGVRDNLQTVLQGAQTRSYGFDDMGRLLSSSTPEAGTVSYQYNNFDLVTQRTDARGVITTYGYDTLNRVHSVSYNVGNTGVAATPGAIYTYGTDPSQNNNGRLITVTDGVGSEGYTYDLLGRTIQLQKVINGTTYQLGYAYNLAGELTSVTYPSGHAVQQSFDAIGRLCEIAPLTTGCGTATSPYATGYAYNTAFQTTGFNYGNGVSASFGYSPDRLQMTSLSYVKGSQTLFNLNYFYRQDPTNCSTGTTANNGQIQCITDGVDSGRNVAYTYDTLGRIATAGTTGSVNYPSWGLSFSLDRYGNRTAQNVTQGSGFPVQTPVDPTTNRVNLPSFTYDASGNTTNDGNNIMAYDAGNRLISSTSAGLVSTYSYDCKGLRVVKASGSSTTVYIFSGSKVIAEYQNGAAPSAPTREYIYGGSTLLAKIEGGATSYYHSDRLSVRELTDNNGNVTGQQGHFPYGESWYDSLSTNEWKFTTYQRDPESGNDYAMARFYENRRGRFASPDRMGGSTLTPQTLNRYSYVANDPANATDPSGNFLLALDRFLFQASFGSNWNEFDILQIELGTAFLFHSDDPNFPFEDFTHDQLMSLSDAEGGDGVIQLLGSYPIYETVFIDPSSSGATGTVSPLRPKDQKNFDKMRDRALRNLLYNQDCIDYLLKNGLDPTTLALGLMAQSTASGDDSTISLASAGLANLDVLNRNESVSAYFSKNPDVTAAAVPNGTTVFYENGNSFSTGQIIHETAHNVTGKDDAQLKTDFGIPQKSKSEEISKSINPHCNHDK